ncbi:MAG: winged helix DNA-binding domain-containing protein [Acidimicrobiales bacterium]
MRAVAGIDAGFEARLVRGPHAPEMLGMRRTVFVLEPRWLRWCRPPAPTRDRRHRAAARREARRRPGPPRGPASWLDELAARIDGHLAEVGEAPAKELSAAIPELATKLHLAIGKPYAGTTGLGSQLLGVLAAEGRIVRTRPLGSWTSSQFRWARTADWLGAPIAPLDPAAARATLVRRWLEQFGPGTVEDVAWWSGLPVGQVRAALATVGAQEVDLDGGQIGLVADGDVEPTPAQPPVAALLPSLDPTTMGWKQRAWYLGDHGPQLFDRNGNGGATIWWDGRIVGGWVQRPSGEIALGVLEDVGREGRDAIDRAAEALVAFYGDVRARSRFPAPIERDLLA